MWRLPLLFVLSLACSAELRAETFPFPSAAAPLLSIDLPQAWQPKVSSDGIEAAEPDDAAYVNLWLWDDEGPMRDLKQDFATLLADSVGHPKLTSEPEKKEINGIEFTTFRGAGDELEENTPISFEVWVFKVKPGLYAVLYLDRDSDAPAELMKTLDAIVRSIRLQR